MIASRHAAGLELRRVGSAARIPPRTDELGRSTFTFPDVGEMRVVQWPGGGRLLAAIRVAFIWDGRRTGSGSPCQTWHGLLSRRNAELVAASLAVVSHDRYS